MIKTIGTIVGFTLSAILLAFAAILIVIRFAEGIFIVTGGLTILGWTFPMWSIFALVAVSFAARIYTVRKTDRRIKALEEKLEAEK